MELSLINQKIYPYVMTFPFFSFVVLINKQIKDKYLFLKKINEKNENEIFFILFERRKKKERK